MSQRSYSQDDLNALLDSPAIQKSSQQHVRKLGYVYNPNKIAHSYSRSNTLHSCARLYQLREINQQRSRAPSIDTSFGSAFGAGIATLFETGSLERAFISALGAWDYPEFDDMYGKKVNKSFGTCLATLEMFYHRYYAAISDEYEIAVLNNRPATELFVYLNIGDKYNYQIHIDIILRSKVTGSLAIVEVKTSGMTAQESDWANSRQTGGYYAILKAISAKLGIEVEPCVYYFCVEAGKFLDEGSGFGVQIFPFVKTPQAIYDFVEEVMDDVRRIETYRGRNYFPKNGGSCTNYRRPCEFFGRCDMKSMLESSDVGAIYESLTLDDCDYVIEMEDLLDTIE